jgi:hypothetical protein
VSGFKIESVTAFVSIDEDGEEGVCAMNLDGVWYPMIMADEERLLQMRPLAEGVAQATGRDVTLIRLDHRTDLEVIPGGHQ